ncbi:MAG: glycoside hydrolase family 43 protein [Verrucomicrobiae bacterium]|nr:glycoside hydrolase family 43 protein [Verrucomicrobiae bacterium]MDW7980196.1 glycoside hydrolase family 43 protein [Verrucomicrobiales bacterium]
MKAITARLVLGLALTFASGNIARMTAEPKPVSFEWFEYSGTNAFEVKPGPGEYQNPILAGFYPDPSICRVGQDYYMVNSTFAYFPGIPIFHSRDLVNWDQLGHVIHRPEQLSYEGLGVSRAIFAPAISYHEGVFYVVCTMVDGIGNFVVTATNAAGPWSDPTPLPFEGIDPSIFFDDDGRAWIVNNGAPEGPPLYNGHRAIWIQEFDYRAKKMVGPRKVLVNGGVDITKKPIWIEGPHIYKVNGWYYLCCAEGGTGPGHSQVIFRSKNVDGPYTPWEKNPILTQRTLPANVPGAVTCTGHADLEIGPDGNWWAVFLGVRPYQAQFSPMGRETFLLPVNWTDDGWPVILPPQERVPLVCKAPRGVEVKPPKTLPLNGNFTWRDEFDQPTLSLAWIMLRAPKEQWWRIDAKAGKLSLVPRAELLSGRGNPSYLGRRVQHPRFIAATEFEPPGEQGVSAGLAAFQGEQYHYYAGAKRGTNGLTIFLEQYRGKEQKIVATAVVPAAKRLRLRIVAHDANCGFDYAVDDGAWRVLASELDAKMLTTGVAKGFVGATVGMHARIEPAPGPEQPQEK